MQPATITLITTFVGIIGALAGVIIGQRMARSWQREQWRLDCRKEEFKEVVSAISNAVIHHMVFVASKGSPVPQPMQGYIDTMKVVFQTLTDRIYIAADLEKANIPQRFLAIMTELRDAEENFDVGADKMHVLLNEVIALGIKG
jgi:hypothetical protein